MVDYENFDFDKLLKFLNVYSGCYNVCLSRFVQKLSIPFKLSVSKDQRTKKLKKNLGDNNCFKNKKTLVIK